MADHPHTTTRRTALASLAAAGALPVAGAALPAVAGPLGPDEPLLALGRAFEAAWAEEIATQARIAGDHSEAADALFDAAFHAVARLVEQIERTPAQTLAGLHVKARAVSWCHSGEPITGYELNSHDTTNVRLAASVLRDLLAMGGAHV